MPKKTADADGLNSLFTGREDFRKRYPAITAAGEAWEDGDNKNPVNVVRITAKKDGFRRGGMVHAGTVDHPVSVFTSPDQLEQILSEPNLRVELLYVEPAAQPEPEQKPAE